MATEAPYKLSIEAKLPEKATEGKIFKVTYEIKNIDTRVSPKGAVHITVSWPNIGPTFIVGHPIRFEKLRPNETVKIKYNVTPATVGMTVFSSSRNVFQTSGSRIWLCRPNGTKFRKGEIFAAVRARSREEIIESWALSVSASALVILILFQLLDWVIRYYGLF